MTTQIFQDLESFKMREDKSINGVSREFAEEYPYYKEMNETNTGCWNCIDYDNCANCNRCVFCLYIDEKLKYDHSKNCIEHVYCKHCINCSACFNCHNLKKRTNVT